MNGVLGIWVLVGIIIGWYLWKRNEKKEIEKKSGIPKGSSGWPFIGETLDIISCAYTSRPVSFMEKRKSLYGKVFKSHLLGRPIIVSTDPDVNKMVLQNNGSTFIPFYPKSITELLGKSSILQMNGNLQKRVHGLIGGFFKSPQLKARITREIEEWVKVSMVTWKDRNLVYIQEETRNITFQVLVRVLMSISPGEDLQFLKREFGEFIKGLLCLPIKFPGTRLYNSLKAKDRLLKMVRRILEEKKMKMERRFESELVMDAMDVLLRDAGDGNETQRLPLDFVCENMIEMMIPGEDSVPMLMTLAVKYLSDCPLALKQLMVISETLRMANIINGVWRKTLKDVKIKGYLIPKGWCLLASFSSVHMDDEIYEKPYEFDPWRWQLRKEGIVVNSSNNFTPFGGGQRLCPGLELSRLQVSIFLHYLVTHYRWVAEEDYIVNFPTVKMKKKLPISVTPTCT
ncbi:hypothetical protein HHK36_003072 [Tetracentron sinense]|uniref:Cytochrome P450 n=1 Tax=Tetracentron sinense TaxID=13715 RepID=A0A834ZWZ1_TETSI|nr:hypothetical protein HHK36_003072 [Tetracentron sinense]